MKKLHLLLIFIPIAPILDHLGANPLIVFLASALAIVPLAALMGDSTEALSEYMGPSLGGLLNATLGNAPEIIIGFFALRNGLIDIVKASITGSILGNLLFGLGLSMFTGGLRNRHQKFEPEVARMNGALLTLASFGLLVPALFQIPHHLEHQVGRAISYEIAVILFLAYLASLVFTLVTHKPVVGQAALKAELKAIGNKSEEIEATEVHWSKNRAIIVLTLVTIALAFMSEVLTGSLEPASKMLDLTPLFTGVFMLAVVGNAAELFNAVRFARKDMMDLAIGITVGASTQVALLVAPLLVFAGVFLGQPMDLVFSRHEVWAIVLAVYFTRNLIYDGGSNWLEGMLLLSIYFMLGIGFFYLPPN